VLGEPFDDADVKRRAASTALERNAKHRARLD
jgi:hypothetical protein